jgi:dephospho-CoA kinase
MSISNKTVALPSLIGLSGTFGSGKDTLAEALVSRFGFHHVSTSDMVRTVARTRYGSVDRPVLHRTANQLRQEQGAGSLVIEALKQSRPLVISGIRSLGEAKEVKRAGGVMVYVDAAAPVRYNRIKSRRRDRETELTLKEFLADEAKEMSGGDDAADFNIQAIGQMADVRLDNSGQLDDFLKAAFAALTKA